MRIFSVLFIAALLFLGAGCSSVPPLLENMGESMVEAEQLDEPEQLFTGRLIEREPDEESAEGLLLLESIDGEETVQFAFGPETRIDLDLGELAEGDLLQIHHEKRVEDCVPNRALALEIRYYNA